MSNQIVGELYSQIINKIIQFSAQDFEAQAYSQEMLLELKRKWQQNLSKMKVAQMPWDPVPINITTSAPSAHAGNSVQAGESSNGAAVKAEVKPEPQVKQEPKYENDVLRFPNYSAGGLNPQAADRAAALLTQKYGSQANASLQAAGLQQPRPLSLPGQRPQVVQLPGQQPRSNDSTGNGLADSQLDGAMEWLALVEQSRSNKVRRPALDRILESTAFEENQPESSIPQEMQEVTFTSLDPLSIPQLDGDGLDDEDAINSELDDDEEDDNQNIADDGQQGEMILCLWDKVNRVKSKWKCTLKDGILSTGGKEYLFQKANGEFEW